MLSSHRPTFALAVLSLCAVAGASAQADPDRAVTGGGTMPAGWQARTDRNRPLANVRFIPMNVGHHVTLGPAAIFWRDADTASRSYSVAAKFWQFPSDTHRDHLEGYGLLIGGSDLDGSGQRYTYFLIRGDGAFLVKRRMGDSTWAVTKDWVPSPAVVKPDSGAKVEMANPTENTLAIRVAGVTMSFLVNDREVYTANAADVDAQGVLGYRVNHNLNVHLGPIAITRQ